MNSDIFLKFHGFYTRMYSSHYWISKIKFKTLGELYILMKKNARNTKGKIVSAAWKLFYQQGYDNTTVEDIIFESETSKGSFYHYFDGKDALMGTLAYVFDEKYEELERSEALAATEDAVDKLILLNHELYVMIESSISIDLLTRLLSTQLLARGEKHLLDLSLIHI